MIWINNIKLCFINDIGAANITWCETILSASVNDAKIPNAVYAIINIIKLQC